MKFFRFTGLVCFAFLLAACVDTSKLSQASVQNYTPAPAGPQTATIRGSGDTSGGFWKATLASYLISVDGKAVTGGGGLLDPVPVTPGIHSLLVGYRYFGGTKSGRVPLMLDARPGASYVVKFEDRGMPNFLTDNADVTNKYLYLDDEKTGAVVTDKVTDTVRRNINLYTEPVGEHLSTLQGAKFEELLGTNYCSVMTIDGKYMPSAPGTPLLTVDHPDYDRAFKITPGRHAIAAGIQFGNIAGAYPFMFDVQPGRSYKIGCKIETRTSGSGNLPVVSFWLEDTVTHAFVMPPTDLPIGL